MSHNTNRVIIYLQCLTTANTHPFTGPFSGTTQESRYQKGKTNLDFTEASDSEWQWHQLGHMQVCTLLQTDNHTSAPPLCFLQAGCPPCHPTNSVKALKANRAIIYLHVGNHNCQQFIIMNTKAYLKSSHNKHHHQIDNSHFSTCTHTHTHTPV